MSATTVYKLGEDATVTIEIREQGGNKKAVLIVLDGDDVMTFDLSVLRFWDMPHPEKSDPENPQ